jgi:non-heme chloroperoxidase
MMFFLLNGYRVIAHDRRGHGRSTQTSGGHDMGHYAVGHSTGGGEVVRYLADGFQGQVAGHHSEFYRDLASGPFYGFSRPGVEASEAIIQNWWRRGP